MKVKTPITNEKGIDACNKVYVNFYIEGLTRLDKNCKLFYLNNKVVNKSSNSSIENRILIKLYVVTSTGRQYWQFLEGSNNSYATINWLYSLHKAL